MNSKGIANVLTVLLITAITIALSGSFIQLTKEISEQIKVSENLNPQTTLQGNIIVIKNTYPLSLNLSDLKLVVNSKTIKIKDENGNGVWDPFETIQFAIPANESVVEVTLTYKDSQIFHAVYVKPSVLEDDKEFPSIAVTADIKGNNLRVRTEAGDDLGLRCVETYYGYVNGSTVLHESENLLEKENIDPKDLAKALMEFHKGHKTNGILNKLREFHREYNFNVKKLRNADVVYLLIKVTDLSGKSSQKVVVLPMSTPTITIKVPETVWVTATENSAKVDYDVIVTDDLGLKTVIVEIDSSLLFNETFEKRTKHFKKHDSVTLNVGSHTIIVNATNVFSEESNGIKTITIKRDYPPSVNVTSPADGSRVLSPFTVTAKVSDDRGISKVEFYENGKLVKTVSDGHTGDYKASFEVSDTATVKVVAYDLMGQSDSDQITVYRDKPPTIEITNLKDKYVTDDGSVTVTVEANAHDDVGISKVVFQVYEGKKLKDQSTDLQQPYSATFTLDVGNYRIIATAYDTAGQTGEDQANVLVVKDSPPNLAVQLLDGGDVS